MQPIKDICSFSLGQYCSLPAAPLAEYLHGLLSLTSSALPHNLCFAFIAFHNHLFTLPERVQPSNSVLLWKHSARVLKFLWLHNFYFFHSSKASITWMPYETVAITLNIIWTPVSQLASVYLSDRISGQWIVYVFVFGWRVHSVPW